MKTNEIDQEHIEADIREEFEEKIREATETEVNKAISNEYQDIERDVWEEFRE